MMLATTSLDRLLPLGTMLSHGMLFVCSVLLLAGWLERTLFFGFGRFRRLRSRPATARGLYGAFAWVGGIAPMTGLLGTVSGIMQAFAAGTGPGNQDQLMAGIASALSATGLGLLLAMGAFTGRATFGRTTDEAMQRAARRIP